MGDGEADAASGAGDEGDVVVKTSIGRSLRHGSILQNPATSGVTQKATDKSVRPIRARINARQFRERKDGAAEILRRKERSSG